MADPKTLGDIMMSKEFGNMFPERHHCAIVSSELPGSIQKTAAQPIKRRSKVPVPAKPEADIKTEKLSLDLDSRTSHQILQSYLITSALYDFDVYEKRILYCLIKYAQKELLGIKFKENIRKIDHSLDVVRIVLPIADFLARTEDTNYTRVKNALLNLEKEEFTFMEKNYWAHIRLIMKPEIRMIDGVSAVTFIVSEKLWDVILDFSKGFSKFYFEVAFSLKSVYSMRLYEMLSSQQHAISYSIEKLRSFFQLDRPKVARATPYSDLVKSRKSEDFVVSIEEIPETPKVKKGGRYKKTSDIIKRIIEPAKAELDEKSPVTFTYEFIKCGTKITAITFHPVTQLKKLNSLDQFNHMSQKYGCSCVLREEEIGVLETVGFTRQGIDNNLWVFSEAKRRLADFDFIIKEMQVASRTKKNPCGWFIEALRGKLDDLKSDQKDD